MQTIAIQMTNHIGTELVLVQADNRFDFVAAVRRVLQYDLGSYYVDNWVTLDSFGVSQNYVMYMIEQMENI